MTAPIVSYIRSPHGHQDDTDFPTIVFRSDVAEMHGEDGANAAPCDRAADRED